MTLIGQLRRLCDSASVDSSVERDNSENSQAEKMSKEIDLDELKNHTDIRSMWIAVHDEVFDITEFLDEHPGGVEVLKEQAGGYATHAFEDVGHSKDARELMKKYLIGTLAEGSREKNKPGRRGVPYSTTDESSTASWAFPVAVAVFIIGGLALYLNSIAL